MPVRRPPGRRRRRCRCRPRRCWTARAPTGSPSSSPRARWRPVFQPIVDLRTGRVYGREALIRGRMGKVEVRGGELIAGRRGPRRPVLLRRPRPRRRARDGPAAAARRRAAVRQARPARRARRRVLAAQRLAARRAGRRRPASASASSSMGAERHPDRACSRTSSPPTASTAP